MVFPCGTLCPLWLRFVLLTEKTMGNDLRGSLRGKKVAFLGAGKMGGIILQALLKNGLLSAKSTCATVAHEERARALAKKLKVRVGTNNVEAAKNADIIVIGVKPQVVEDVVREISRHITPEATDRLCRGFSAHYDD